MINFDPASLIRPPFARCPKCAQESFGILMIQGLNYFRRCRACFHSQMFRLPRLRKKVIYLDQFALSNIMKALNPDTKAHKRGIDPFWITLFNKLDNLCKLQLIVCPESSVHEKESRVSSHFEAIRRINELLSGGVRFHDIEEIRNGQLLTHCQKWIAGNDHEPFEFQNDSIVYGDIDHWTDPIYVSVTMPWQPDWIENLRNSRIALHKRISDVFSRWQTETGKSFDFWFNEELNDYGVSILKQVNIYNKSIGSVLNKEWDMQWSDLIVPPAVQTYLIVVKTLQASGLAEKDLGARVYEYFTSPALASLPFLRLLSMIFASVARKAAAGMKELPSQGLSNDVDAISTLLPYCDAMFIDNECRAYFDEEPLRSDLTHETRLFSLRNKEALLEYLDSIKAGMTAEHLQIVDGIYGEGWTEPYTTVFGAAVEGSSP